MVSFSDRKQYICAETVSISRNAWKANWIEQISSSTSASKGIKCDLPIACRVSVATNILFNILQLMDTSDFLLIFLVILRHILHSKFYYILAAFIMLIFPGLRVLYTYVHSKTSTANTCCLQRNTVCGIYNIDTQFPYYVNEGFDFFKISIFYKI